MLTHQRSLKISEIFSSIQGEGVGAGSASVFVRLATCNLSCRWCDTRYSWDFAAYDYRKEVSELSVEQVAQRVVASGERRMVLTGGEPLIQQQALMVLLQKLPGSLYIEVETNGTLAPLPELIRRVDQWNVSPKLANSAEPARRRLKPEVLAEFRSLEHAWLKLVVATESDFAEAAEVVDSLQWPRKRVLMMPRAQTRSELSELAESVQAACTRLGYRYSPRLHIEWYDGERGR